MPSIEIDISQEVDFEVICKTCNSGLCNSTDVRYSRNRNVAQVLIECCGGCLSKKDDEIKELQHELEEKEGVISTLEDKITELEYIVGDLNK
jgi:predicted RNase H-like nuclease (RuvC/YqgF family)